MQGIHSIPFIMLISPVESIPPLPLAQVVSPERGGLRPQRVPLLHQRPDVGVGILAKQGSRLGAYKCSGVPVLL